MTLSSDPDGDAQRRRFAELLDAAASRRIRIPFWWRDDDAETVTPALEGLLALARKHQVPLALAVVPRGATASLAARLANGPAVSVLQHGWQHRNYAPAAAKKAELGDHRPARIVLDELRLGFDRLAGLFGNRFLPVLVPPWNRIAESVREARREIGLIGFSDFGPAPAADRHWVNPHLDIFEWRPTKKPISRARAYSLLSKEVERRLAGDPEPIGIMTHHLVHEEASWDFLDEFFALTAPHEAVVWPSIAELFRLAANRP